MTDKAPVTWRYNFVFLLLTAAAVGLCARLALLVRGGQAEADSAARRQQKMVIPLAGRPGSIFARTRGSYVPMAVSRQTPSCYVDPFLLRDEEIDPVSRKLAGALSLEEAEVKGKILRRRTKRFCWIARDLTGRQHEAVRKLRLPGVVLTHEWKREYIEADLAGTVVGFRLRDGSPGGGLELGLDCRLKAADGRSVMLADAFRRPIWPLTSENVAPRDGCNVFLCLDAVIQQILQAAVAESVGQFDAKWGTGIVVDPTTGEILAMCSSPTFDPAEFNVTPAGCRTNRAVCVPFEPGSAAKPIFAAAAVDAGVVNFQTQIFCENGVYHASRGGRISDHGSHYGHLTVEDVVVFSSNIGMAKIGEKLGNRALHETARRFGFGRRTGIDTPGESPGIIRPLRQWDGYSLRRVPFGQEISTTALQMVMAFCSLANGGVLMRPQLVSEIRAPSGRVVWRGGPRAVRRTLKPSVAARALATLEQVVERGTGRRSKMKRWTSFGKTGTAQIAADGGYVSGAYVGTFIAGAPVGGPRAVCIISIYWPDRAKGYYGAKVAAPFVKKVLEKTLTYLAVPPDRPEEDWAQPTAYAARAGR